MSGIAQGMADAGNQVFVLTPFNTKLQIKNRGNFKIIPYKYIWPDSLHKLGYSQTLSNDLSLKPLMYLLSPFMYFFGIIALVKLIRKEKIDIVNAHWILPNGFISGVAAKITGVPSVPTLPGSDVYMARKNGLFRLLAKLSKEWAAAITSNSGGLLKDLAEITGKIRNQTVIIYGVDPKEFKPQKTNLAKLKKSLNISANDLVVVGVGRLVEKKGFRYLIRAIPKVISKHKNVSFIVVGDGAERKMLEELAKKLKVNNNVKFTGMIDYKTLIDYDNLGDIFILPSVHDREGNLDDQSVSVIEAMSCGKPIITTNFPGYKIVVKNGENGFLTDEKNSNQIASAINKLVENPSLRLNMGKKSRELVLKKFAWQAIGKEYTDYFNGLLKGNSQNT